MKKHIPNMITLSNAFSGFVGIVAAFNGQWRLAFYMLLFAVAFDMMDGLSARLLKVPSELGKQLDSLADIISFGVLPGMIMFDLMANAVNLPHFSIQTRQFYIHPVLPYIAALIPLFSALRLAKFNIDTRQSSSFLGLPTPANALFIGSLSMVIHSYCSCDPIMKTLHSWEVLTAITVIASLLLVVELPLFAFKLKNLKFKENIVQYSFLIILPLIFVGIIISEGWSKWFLIITYGVLYYVVHSLIAKLVFKKEF